MADEDKKEGGTEWMQKLWRPAMGWMYMLICLADMIVFPVLWSLLQAVTHTPITQWNPLTLQGAGLFHIAMGAVLGISAFGRTQEKLAGTAANPSSTPTSTGGFGNGNTATPATGFSGGSTAFSPPSTGSFSSPSTSFGSTPLGGNSASSFGGGGFGGAPAPATTASGKKIVPDFDQPAI